MVDATILAAPDVAAAIEEPYFGKHLACQRVPVSRCPARIPVHYIEALEQNQQIASCCRHPENHEISAWYSSDADRDKGIPDIYVFHCTCGRNHRRFCIGGRASDAVLKARDALHAEIRAFDAAPDAAATVEQDHRRELLAEIDRHIARGKRPFWEIR